MSINASAITVWPEPQEMKLGVDRLALAEPLQMKTQGLAPWLRDVAKQVAEALNRAAGKRVVIAEGARGPVKLTVSSMDAAPKGIRPVTNDEGYALSITPQGIHLAGKDARGIFYGAQTLAQLLCAGDTQHGPQKGVRPSHSVTQKGVRPLNGLRGQTPFCSAPYCSLPFATIRDWPKFPYRGLHCYLPAREQLDFFIRFLDFMAAHKLNTLALEVSGGFEYKKHPEINRAWEKFCKDAWAYEYDKDRRPERRHPSIFGTRATDRRGGNAISDSSYFGKDSTHTELAGGTWLTRTELKRIRDACAARHIEIIPEVQSLSHCYYLCMAHPEIAERKGDPWPDSYCPSNPKSYELYFDVLDEVIDFFKPKIVHIGHDEEWSTNVCPTCKKQSPHETLAGDLNRIIAFLASRGVRTTMWAGELYESVTTTGNWGFPGGSRRWYRYAKNEAIDMIPKTLIAFDHHGAIEYFGKHGLEVICGNFLGNFDRGRSPNWEKRADPAYVRGGVVSTWSEVSSHAFGHNMTAYKLFDNAELTWHGKHVPDEQLNPLMVRRLAPVFDRLTGVRRWMVSGGKGAAVALDISSATQPLPRPIVGKVKTGGKLSTMLGSVSFDVSADKGGALDRAVVLRKNSKGPAAVPVGRKGSRLILLHASTMERVFLTSTYGSLCRGSAELLRCRVKYADGKEQSFSALFGDDIGPLAGKWPTSLRKPAWRGRKPGGYCYRALPVPAQSEHTFFAQEWVNPRPDVQIKSIRFEIGADAMPNGAVIIPAVSIVA